MPQDPRKYKGVDLSGQDQGGNQRDSSTLNMDEVKKFQKGLLGYDPSEEKPVDESLWQKFRKTL